MCHGKYTWGKKLQLRTQNSRDSEFRVFREFQGITMAFLPVSHVNVTHFFILFGMRDKWPFFELCISPVLRQDQDIWNFYGSLTLNNGKPISDVLEALTMPLCQI